MMERSLFEIDPLLITGKLKKTFSDQYKQTRYGSAFYLYNTYHFFSHLY